MKKYLIFLTLLLPLLYFGCKESDPDIRQQFIGTYGMDTFDLKASDGDGDTTITIETNPAINLNINSDLDADEIEADVEEFIQETMTEALQRIFGVSSFISFQFVDDGVAEIDNSSFQIREQDFTLLIGSAPYFCELDGDGELMGGKLTFDYEITLFTGSNYLVFSGIATGEVQ